MCYIRFNLCLYRASKEQFDANAKAVRLGTSRLLGWKGAQAPFLLSRWGAVIFDMQ